MPLQKLQYRPGLNREGTDYANEGGFYDGDKIRFRSGFPEKLGGWTRMSSNTYIGVARSMWNWVNSNGSSNYLGIGTNVKYYIETSGSFYDITPIVEDTTFTGAASPASGITATAPTTLNGSIDATQTTLFLTSGAAFPNAGVILIDSEQIRYTGRSTNTLTGLTRGYNSTTPATHANGAAVSCATLKIIDAGVTSTPAAGDYIIISGTTSLGGNITSTVLDQEYEIASNISATSYTINAKDTSGALVFATASDTGYGGTLTIEYELPKGSDIYTVGTGWGAGPWSRGTWGSGYSVGIGQQLRLWSNDNYGQDLVIAPRGGAIYYWTASGGTSTRAVTLKSLASSSVVDPAYPGYTYQSYVPTATNQVVASSIQQFVIALGSNSYVPGSTTTFDPMLVRWSDQANPTNWVPDVTNQSGEFALTNGSYIMGGRTTRQEILIWTDSCLYSMQYLGPPYVWGFNVIMDNISVISPNSMITINNITYWMGTDKFYMYSGRVETLPCSLRQYIYTDINKDQAFQIFAGGNEGYNEVWWFYCSTNSTVIDKYIIYNYLDRVWYYGTMSRTAWLDSGIRPYPMAADYNNRILYHESSVDDESGTSPAPIYSYVKSSDFDIDDGHNFGFVWRILPDVNFNGSTSNNPAVTMTVMPRQNSGTAYGAADNTTVRSANNYTTQQQYTIQQFTGQVYTRLRGRQLSFMIESFDLGVTWQLGIPRIDIRKDGRR